MAYLQTIGDLIAEVRLLLQDQGLGGTPTRWSDTNIVQALNMGLAESFRVRPDFWRGVLTDYPSDTTIPQFDATQLTSAVPFPFAYVPALIDYITGMTQMADLEGTQDARAAGLLKMFTDKLLSNRYAAEPVA